MSRIMNKILPIVICYDPDIGRKDLCIKFLDLCLNLPDNFGRVLTFSHQDNAFNNIGMVVKANLTQPGKV